MEYTNLIYKYDETSGIARLSINRPQVKNALNKNTRKEIRTIVDSLKNDYSVKVLIITGAGQDSFVSGADVLDFKDAKPIDIEEYASTLGQQLFTDIENLPMPVIAMINGYCFGGGCELAMSCDIRIASDNSKFGQLEINLGFIPGAGGTQRLPRLVGIENAWPILRSGNPISSAQAKEIGLIQEEVEGDLIDAAITWVKNILSGKVRVTPIRKDPIPIPSKLPEVDIGHLSRKIDSLLQKAILEGAKMNLDEGLKLEARISGECFLTEDMHIGLDNFVKNGPRVKANFVHK